MQGQCIQFTINQMPLLTQILAIFFVLFSLLWIKSIALIIPAFLSITHSHYFSYMLSQVSKVRALEKQRMQSLPCYNSLVLLLSTLFAFPIFSLSSDDPFPCSKSDLTSLHAFQSSLSTPLPWQNNTDCCSWLGIRCDTRGRVVALYLPSSNLSGSISPHLFQLSALVSLNLTHNSLSGHVAPDIANLSLLTTLDLSHNPSLSSHETLLLPTNLHHLDLSHCSFAGSISINASSLQGINISNNFFASVVMDTMIPLRSLQTFDASRNLLSTSLLQVLCKCENLRVLNLEHNFFRGLIPSEIGMLSKLELVRLQGNRIGGFIPHELGNCLQVQEVWLNDNCLSGTIPKEVGKLVLLTTLSLANNRLEGRIPSEIVKCRQLSFLSLSGNMLSGEMPYVIDKLATSRVDGRKLDLAGLATIQGRQSLVHWLQALDELRRSEFVPSHDTWRSLIQSKSPSSLHRHHRHHRHLLQSHGLQPMVTGVISGIVVFCGVLLIALAVALCRMKLRPWHRRRRRAPYSLKMGSLRKNLSERSQVFDPSLTSISMREIVTATGNFDPRRVIGDGGFGLVYRANLSDGRAVAVKKLATDGIQGKREFEAEMETLGHIRHQNLVELLAFCQVGEERALVYEYMENGSLDTWLHERGDGPQQLGWETRIKITMGAANGLMFLHHECDPHVIHRDIKSSNILLSKDFEARITDFGLARLMSPHLSHVSTEAAGTLGYMAPEYHMTMRATEKIDVYSFGMLMLELASGRRPNSLLENKKFGTLAKWAQHVAESGSENDIIDPILKERAPPPPYDQVRAFVAIACRCVSLKPEDRPTMKEAFEQLSLLNVDPVERALEVKTSAEL